jgi:uncharacterized protein (DUF952 family)
MSAVRTCNSAAIIGIQTGFSMSVVYHIARRTDWNAALAAGSYAAASVAVEGFIHCSTAQQVTATANRLFKGRDDLVLLSIDTAKVKADIRYENLEGGTNLFPHVYGALELDSICSVHDFPPQADGSFALPPALTALS